MASIAELEALLAELKPKLIAAKKVDKASEESKQLTQELLGLKKAITEIAPEHPDAIKKKEKKKKGGDAKQGPTKKELRMMEREKKMKELAASKAKKAAEAGNFGELPICMSQSCSGREWTNVEDLNKSLIGQKVLVRASLHQVRDQNKIIAASITPEFLAYKRLEVMKEVGRGSSTVFFPVDMMNHVGVNNRLAQ